MSKRKHLVIGSIRSEQEITIDDFQSAIIQNAYNPEIGFGFEKIEIYDNILNAKFIKRSFTIIHDFDIETRDFVRKQVALYTEVEFEIDFNIKVFIVFGNLTHYNHFRSAMRKSLPNKVEFLPIQKSVNKFYLDHFAAEDNIVIEEIAIERFNFQDGIIGRFSGKVLKPEIADSLLYEYKDQVRKLLFSYKTESTSSKIMIARNGVITIIYKDKDDLAGLIEIFKNKLFE